MRKAREVRADESQERIACATSGIDPHAEKARTFALHKRSINTMAARGVHFSLSEDEAQELLGFETECDRVEHLHEVIEEEYFENQPERKAESDKAWDAMQRVFEDDYPLSHLVLGGESICSDRDHVMILKTPQQVRDVAAALPAVTEAAFRARYFKIDPAGYDGEVGEQDFGYTWEWFQEVREFWLRAAEEGRYVLFTADQ
jgi:hypothetical protein